MTSIDQPVLRTAYQRSVAEYWNAEKDPVNLRLGDVDGLYHHHYGIGGYDASVLDAPEEIRDDAIIAELHRLETAQADVLLDHLGDVRPEALPDLRRLDLGLLDHVVEIGGGEDRAVEALLRDQLRDRDRVLDELLVGLLTVLAEVGAAHEAEGRRGQFRVIPRFYSSRDLCHPPFV